MRRTSSRSACSGIHTHTHAHTHAHAQPQAHARRWFLSRTLLFELAAEGKAQKRRFYVSFGTGYTYAIAHPAVLYGTMRYYVHVL